MSPWGVVVGWPMLLVARVVQGVLALARLMNSPRGRASTMWAVAIAAWWVWMTRDSGLALLAFLAAFVILMLLD